VGSKWKASGWLLLKAGFSQGTKKGVFMGVEELLKHGGGGNMNGGGLRKRPARRKGKFPHGAQKEKVGGPGPKKKKKRNGRTP